MFKEKVRNIIDRYISKIYRAIKYSKVYIYFSIFGSVFLVGTLILLYQRFKKSAAIMEDFPGIIMTLASALVISLFFVALKEILVYINEKEECKEQAFSFFRFRNKESDKSIVKIVEEKFKSLFM